MNDSSKAYYSSEIEDFLSSKDLNAHDCTIMLEDIPKLNYNLDLIFKDRFFTIVYISNNENNEGTDIGHFTLLSQNEGSLEFFDSTGQKPSKIIYELASHNNINFFANRFALQGINTYTCPKWVVSRILSLPTSLKTFQNIFLNNSKLSPDQIVDALYVLKSKK